MASVNTNTESKKQTKLLIVQHRNKEKLPVISTCTFNPNRTETMILQAACTYPDMSRGLCNDDVATLFADKYDQNIIFDGSKDVDKAEISKIVEGEQCDSLLLCGDCPDVDLETVFKRYKKDASDRTDHLSLDLIDNDMEDCPCKTKTEGVLLVDSPQFDPFCEFWSTVDIDILLVVVF